MEEIYRLDTRDKPRVLVAMMHALAAENGRISFEGKPSQTELAQMAGVASEESGVLKGRRCNPNLISWFCLSLAQPLHGAAE
jgi:hypothetical protein